MCCRFLVKERQNILPSSSLPLIFIDQISSKSWDSDGLFDLSSNQEDYDDDFEDIDVDIDVNVNTTSPPTFANRFSAFCDIIPSETRFSLPLRNRYLQQVFAAFGLWQEKEFKLTQFIHSSCDLNYIDLLICV